MQYVLGALDVLIGLGFLLLARTIRRGITDMRAYADMRPESSELPQKLIRNSRRLMWVCILAGACFSVIGVFYAVLHP